MNKNIKKRSGQINYEEMKEYGDYFKFMRKSIGYTLQMMSKEIGVCGTTIGKWERGLNIPSKDIYLLELKYREVVKRVIERQRKRGILTNNIL